MTKRRKTIALAALFAALLAPAIVAGTGTIKEADYPNQYEILDTSATNKLVVEKSCAMTLRDKAKPDVAISVSRKSYGSCHLLESGKVFRGRPNEKKNEIDIVIPVGEDKARVETWQIVGTADLKPK